MQLKTLIASLLSTSLVGCASKPSEGPEIFDQKVYSSDKDMEKNGYILINKKDSKEKTFIKRSLNEGKVTVYTDERNSSTIDKKSDDFTDYQSCITAFNEENKKIQEILSSSEKTRKIDDNNASFSYGGTGFKVKSEPCTEIIRGSEKVKTYSYNIHMEGLSEKEKSKALEYIGAGALYIVALPFMLVGAVVVLVIAPILLIGWAVDCKLFGGYCGG